MGTRILLDSESLTQTARLLGDAAAWLDEIAGGLSRIAASVPEVEPLLDSAAFTLRRVALESSIDSQDLVRRAGCCCGMDVGGLSLPALATSAIGLAASGGAAVVATGAAAPAAAGGYPGTGDWMDRMDTPVTTDATVSTAGWPGAMDAAGAGGNDWAAVGGAVGGGGGWEQGMAANNARPSAIDTSSWPSEIHDRTGIRVSPGGLEDPAETRAVFNQTYGPLLDPGGNIITSGIASVDPIIAETARVQGLARGPIFDVPTLNVAAGMAEVWNPS